MEMRLLPTPAPEINDAVGKVGLVVLSTPAWGLNPRLIAKVH